MKIAFLLIPLLTAATSTATWAQDRIYRCGNEYTNTVTPAEAKNCKLVSGGNVTVVQAAKPNSNTNTNTTRVAAATQPGQRVDAGEQRAKDSDSRMILESELKKAEALQAELVREYNKGEPEKLGIEARNPQKYVERVAELKAKIARNESDIEGIRRELLRSAATSIPSNTNSALR